MDKVIAANAKAISVAASQEHRQFVIGELYSGGYSQRPAVQGMHAVCVDEPRKVGRTPDAADGDHIVISAHPTPRLGAELPQCAVNSVTHFA
jgi:hypothetical protein